MTLRLREHAGDSESEGTVCYCLSSAQDGVCLWRLSPELLNSETTLIIWFTVNNISV